MHPALEHIIVDHQDHLGLLGRREKQVLLDQEGTKVNQVCPVTQEDQEPQRECQLMLEDPRSKDHRVHLDLLDVQDHRELKVTPELLVYLALHEAQSQSPQGLLVLQVLLALQAIPAPSLLLRCTSTSPAI